MQVKQQLYGACAILLAWGILPISACNEVYQQPVNLQLAHQSVLQPQQLVDSALFDESARFPYSNTIYTRNTNPDRLLQFARTLMGTPYVYGATDPKTGFDCSGFITYIFNHFNIQVPRASVSFTNIQKEVPLESARPGDIILFAGTEPGDHTVGHMGIIENIKKEQVFFIHASSGKANAVTISPLDAYYKGRFVKLLRVFPDSAD